MSTKLNDNTVVYCKTALARAGVCILESGHACAVRPDLWSTDRYAATDWPAGSELDRLVASTRARRFVVEFEDSDGRRRRLRVAAMSDRDLARRLEYLLGLEVTVRPVLSFAASGAEAGA